MRLVVPPSSEFLRTIRLVAADAAVRAGLDCEEVEDFRIAVDELSHFLMGSTDDYVEFRVVATDESVVAHGSVQSRTGAASGRPNDLSTLILASTTDYYTVETDDGKLTFTVAKQAHHVLADQR